MVCTLALVCAALGLRLGNAPNCDNARTSVSIFRADRPELPWNQESTGSEPCSAQAVITDDVQNVGSAAGPAHV
jgi:hypothetical protein